MTLDEFSRMERLPTAVDLIGLCEILKIKFALNEQGKPVLKPNGEAEIGNAIAGLLRREPWRTQVIEAKQLKPPSGLPAGTQVMSMETGRIWTLEKTYWPDDADRWWNAAESRWQDIPPPSSIERSK